MAHRLSSAEYEKMRLSQVVKGRAANVLGGVRSTPAQQHHDPRATTHERSTVDDGCGNDGNDDGNDDHGRLESLRQVSHNPRLCSGVTIHERSNEDDDCGNDATTTATTTRTNSSSIIIISFFLQIRGERERDNRGERVLRSVV